MSNERIQLTDSTVEIIYKLSEGNPGAATVLLEILKQEHDIDPQGMPNCFGAILNLDTLNVYGGRIWGLYKDVCGENLVSMLAVLRANQLGFITASKLNHAIDNRGDGLIIEDILKQVKDRLSEFDSKSNPTA